MSASSDVRAVETLRWRGDRLELIDQRHLPSRLDYVSCASADDVAAAIRAMVVRGAPAIGCAAAFGIALEARKFRDRTVTELDAVLEQAHSTLAKSRPTAVNLFWALDRMREARAAAGGRQAGEIAASLLEAAVRLYEADLETNRAIGRAGAGLIPDAATVMTHCNAGALATAGHGTALGMIRSARDQGKKLAVIASETRPYLQGARLTAWEMVQEGIPVTLITDSMAGHLMQQGRIDMVIVGADRIAANGDVANKIGTYTLAVLAARHGIPFYVAAPLSTIDPDIPDGSAIPIEQRDAAEVTGYGGVRWAAEGVNVLNPAFDVTPAALVTALVTEKGVLEKPDRARIAGLLRP